MVGIVKHSHSIAATVKVCWRDLRDVSSADTAWETRHTCESPCGICLWSWQPIFHVLRISYVSISLQIWRWDVQFGFSLSAPLLVPCETTACAMNCSSQENDSLRGPRQDLIPSCLRPFKAWVMLRALGSTVTDSRWHMYTSHSPSSELAIFPSSWDTAHRWESAIKPVCDCALLLIYLNDDQAPSIDDCLRLHCVSLRCKSDRLHEYTGTETWTCRLWLKLNSTATLYV